MPEFFTSYDGTRLAYHRSGDGPPLVVIPGDPGRASTYLGTVGGLDAHHTLIILDHRGTGASSDPVDPATLRGDRLPADVEVLREHLRLGTFDLLGHSAGAQVAVFYAAAHPHRLRRLVLVCGGHRTTGAVIDGGFAAACQARREQSWYPAARTALDIRTARGAHTPPQVIAAMAPFFYGSWDASAQAHAAAEASQRRDPQAAHRFHHGLHIDTTAMTAALGVLPFPVLVLAGEYDPQPVPQEAAQLVAVFPDAQLHVQIGAGHYPWVDDPTAFTTTVAGFLGHVP
ncbi:alpha/beta hydrolase [Micromonospora sp. WMMA1363]|uniref:alpha/beta fold hydrolase n=1 Tax=Micromonospora sp. WMMA1363 TaxID=3053985 RepID=UPI00259D12CD|nr:alpha/beta hydrolase [Micromonospora sp. WMMA1363]MDM4719180.1 alpha/beta hydrolase [Micromonospora sp. WMMA1363]